VIGRILDWLELGMWFVLLLVAFVAVVIFIVVYWAEVLLAVSFLTLVVIVGYWIDRLRS
jgi:hypothetical protein